MADSADHHKVQRSAVTMLLEQLQSQPLTPDALGLYAEQLKQATGAERVSIQVFEPDDSKDRRRSHRHGGQAGAPGADGDHGLGRPPARRELPIRIRDDVVGIAVFENPDHDQDADTLAAATRPLLTLLGTHLAIHRASLEAAERSATDELTGVLARSAILRELADRADRADRFNTTADRSEIGLLYIDLDGFKPVNDTYGHAAGDRVLRTIAQRFAAELRAEDRLGRLGGDEFLVILGPGADESTMLALAKRLSVASVLPVDVGLTEVTVGCSIGASLKPEPAHPPAVVTDLLFEADLAMYQAKRSADSVVLADESIGRHADLIAAVDRDLEAAIADRCLFFEYQPLRCLSSLEILAIEGYARWDHPEHGPVPSPLIVERMEKLGLIPAFTRWSLETAGDDLLRLRELAPAFGDKSTSVNFTTNQLAWPGFLEAYEGLLTRKGLRYVDVCVDVVEAGVVEVGPAAENALAVLYDKGTIVTLDDFGTSHNVLGYFTQFPVKSIKFDSSLVASLPGNDRIQSVVRGLSQVAHELDIYTLAEGIENAEQLDLCIALGIVKGQGTHLGPPVSLEQIAETTNRELPRRANR